MQTTFNIQGMSCQHCVNNVKQAFEKMEGVNSVSVSLEKGTASISYDEHKADENTIKTALAETSYKIIE
ncbi:MAG: heavy-metal-associated domain-containing protein [Chitinophagales bacterium]|nr:heavy-metal-associated domain-containing protein [Chitinophagales bacterium]